MTAATKPRLLDLFCGAGGAAMGYHRAGFEVVGVDIEPQPNYPFEFIQADVFELLEVYVRGRRVGGFPRWGDFDAVHASPPCQGYTQLAAVNRALGRPELHAKLIGPTRELLRGMDVPYVIENVVGAPLLEPVRLCGTSFGLPLRRHRLFEANVPLRGRGCEHGRFTEPLYWTGWRPDGEVRRSTVVQVYGNAAEKHEWPAAMGVDWMTYGELAEAVPPAYTEHIGSFLIAEVNRRNEAAA